MITQVFKSNAAFRITSIGSLLLVGALVIARSLQLNGTGNPTQQITAADQINAKAGQETFQELGFFGEVKKDKWNGFVGAVQNNIIHSRKEKGNLSFSLYQPEDGKLQPIWFERFESKAAHNYHKEQGYFKDAITVIQQSLAGEAKSITLKILDEIPAMIPKISDRTGTARHVIVLFDVKPEKRKAFIDAMAEGVSPSRTAKGNLEFNLYGYADDPNKFVLIEGWQSQADHEAQLKQDHIKRLTAALQGLFVSDPINNRYIVKDISQ
jgi:quinol monooxygenase YgiN